MMTTSNEHNNAPAVPLGYFRAEPFGWTDCAATDEGAIALYEHPAAPAVPQGWVKASDRMPLDGYSDGLREIADELDAVQKDLAGIELQADGNANFYWLMRDGKWIAKIQMNGEMLVDKQVALLEAMLSAGTQIAHCPKCFTCFEVGSGSTEQNPWRDAVIEQLESWHICVPAIHDNSPRLAIKALVNIETKAALDPAVSSEAAALVAGQHNNAPAVPQGEPVAWMVYGNYTRQPFGMLSSAEAYMRGLLKSDPDRACAIRRNYQPPSPNRSNP